MTSFAVRFRASSGEVRFQACPSCGPRSRSDAIAANRGTGLWLCHAHGCKGDLLALVAGLAGLDVEREFHRVIELAADIAGVVALPGATETLQSAQGRIGSAFRSRAPRCASKAPAGGGGAAGLWTRLERESADGLRYLTERRIDRARAEDPVRPPLDMHPAPRRDRPHRQRGRPPYRWG